MNLQANDNVKRSWAGPALFTAVLAALVVFFWWLL